MPRRPPSIPHSPRTSGARRPYAPRLPPEERREQLIDAALRVIVDEGYGGVSIEAIARAAGVTRPVVYDHFPNLARLLAAVIEREEQYALSVLDAITPADPDGSDPYALIVGGVRQFLECVLERPDTWRLILFPVDGTPAIVREPVEANRARVQRRIETMVVWSLAHPGMPQDIDVELTARAIRSLAEEAGRMVLTAPEEHPPARYERFVARILALISAPR